MIKINLSSVKTFDPTNVGGFDFTKLNVKFLLVVIVLMFLPDYVLIPVWDEERAVKESEIATKTTELGDLKKKTTKMADLEKKVNELKAQEENLGQRLTAVKKAISEKKNPSPLLLYIAKNVPSELWVTELSIDNNSMTIKGESLDYSSIGSFVNNLRSSVFVSDVNIGKTESKVREADKRRIESFEVKFTIGRFDP